METTISDYFDVNHINLSRELQQVFTKKGVAKIPYLFILYFFKDKLCLVQIIKKQPVIKPIYQILDFNKTNLLNFGFCQANAHKGKKNPLQQNQTSSCLVTSSVLVNVCLIFFSHFF
eukprot:TRINITY_DN1917_c0_g1_i3.p6 TRINITY_DN1917_c0_g1~~TRINITY_DN1917_c0_g1_i3.p6  ORF type:complete len:117 (+),score=0.95 TRINITY_DN1917_c0_g1_i3:356-706(+)